MLQDWSPLPDLSLINPRHLPLNQGRPPRSQCGQKAERAPCALHLSRSSGRHLFLVVNSSGGIRMKIMYENSGAENRLNHVLCQKTYNGSKLSSVIAILRARISLIKFFMPRGAFVRLFFRVSGNQHGHGRRIFWQLDCMFVITQWCDIMVSRKK